MERNESTTKLWSRRQVCGLAVICLISAIGVWYFIRAPFHVSAVSIPAAAPGVGNAPDMNAMIDQLQQDADTQAEPLLARLRTSPSDPLLLAEIGKIYYQTRRFALAAEYYGKSVRFKPDAGVFVKLGGAYHHAGDEDKAIDAWNHALRLDPGNPDALFNIGYIKWRTYGDVKAAIDAWQKLLQTNPQHPRRTQVEALLAQARQHRKIPATGNE